MLRLEEDELQRGDLCAGCFDRRDQAADLIWWRTSHQERKGGMRMDFELVLALILVIVWVAISPAPLRWEVSAGVAMPRPL